MNLNVEIWFINNKYYIDNVVNIMYTGELIFILIGVKMRLIWFFNLYSFYPERAFLRFSLLRIF